MMRSFPLAWLKKTNRAQWINQVRWTSESTYDSENNNLQQPALAIELGSQDDQLGIKPSAELKGSISIYSQ